MNDVKHVVNKILGGCSINQVISEAVSTDKQFSCEFRVIGPGREYMKSSSTYGSDDKWPPRWIGTDTGTIGDPGDIVRISHKDPTTNPIYWRIYGDAVLATDDSVLKFVIPENAKGLGHLYIDVVGANDPGSDDIFLYIDLDKSDGWARDINFYKF